MDTHYPLRDLKMVAASVGDDLGFVALADVARALASAGAAEDWRLIGGHMVTIHVQRWGLGRELYRETRDADVGIAGVALTRSDPVSALSALGYRQTSGSRFEKAVGEQTQVASIDVLVPAYTSRARKSVRVGDIVTTEVPGLASTLQRDPVAVRATLVRLGGDELTATLLLPDEIGALVMKAGVFAERGEGKDAVDVWRCMEVAYAAGTALPQPGDGETQEARNLIARGFADDTSPMMKAIVVQLGLAKRAARQRQTRIRALMKQLL